MLSFEVNKDVYINKFEKMTNVCETTGYVTEKSMASETKQSMLNARQRDRVDHIVYSVVTCMMIVYRDSLAESKGVVPGRLSQSHGNYPLELHQLRVI